MNKRLSNGFSSGVLFLLLLTLIFAIWKQQGISDWLRLRNYAPSAAISDLANNTTMTDPATRMFYVYYPNLEGKASFRDACPGFDESIVLGCYISGQSMTILDVSDDRLAGIEEVTAAHEMLHVAYERLSSSERKRINKLLHHQETLLGSNDERIKTTLNAYDKNSSDYENEMHSIFGSELANLEPELEQYYSRYFKDRSKVVSYAVKYASAFVEREQRVEQIDKQLEAMRPTIDSLKGRIASLDVRLDRERAEMQQLRQSNQTAFNQRVDGYNSLVRQYNGLIDETRTQIETYNQLVGERNSIALEEKDLMDAISSGQTSL